MRNTAYLAGLLLVCGILHGQVATTTALSVSPGAPLFGQAVMLTATVTPSLAPGAVSFFDRGTLVGTATLNANGVAQMTTITLPAGQHSLRAVYGGGAGGYQSSQSAATPYVVSPAGAAGFFAAVNYAAGSIPYSVAAGDFNGDGKADFAAVNQGSNNVSVLLGNGTGTFQTAVNYAVGSGPYHSTVGDFNADGRTDLAVVNRFSNNVSVLLGNGNGTFQAAVNYSTGSGPFAIAVSDFNLDGKADLVVSTYSSTSVSLLLGNGNGTFQAAVNHGSGVAETVAVGDFNGDGKPDFAVANSSNGSLGLLLGNGDGTFQSPTLIQGLGAFYVTAGDLNADGKDDLVCTTYFFPGLSVLLGNGNGTFQTPANYAGSGRPILGDVNGDGKLDVVTSSGVVRVLRGNGDGTLQPAVTYPAGTNPGTVAISEFNGDAGADLVVANSNSNNVSVLLGRVGPYTDILLSATPSPSLYGQPVTLTADVSPATATGRVEFLDGTSVIGVGTLNLGRAQIASVLLSPGAHSLKAIYEGVPGVAFSSQSNAVAHTVTSFSRISFTAPVNHSAGTNPASVATGDFNGDGKADLAVANNGSNNVSILLGNGNGTFAAPANYGAGTSPASVAVGDFNGDGRADLAVANSGSSDLSVLSGNGNGTFAAAVSYAAGTNPVSVAVGDVNLDGKADLVTANFGGANLSVLLGNGNGTFQASMSYAAGIQPRSVGLGDSNRDGNPDLIASNAGSNNVSVLLGNGNGTFAAAVNHSVGTMPVSVSVEDLDLDGASDFATANLSSDNVSVVASQPAVNYAAGSGPSFVLLTDLSGDGRRDLAVANPNGGNVGVLRNNGSGTFQAALNFAVGSGANAFAVGDFNGDSRADLAVTTTAGVNVLLGIVQPPTAVSVTPAGGTGSSFTFAFTFSDPDGYQDLDVINVLIRDTLDAQNACFLGYQVSANRLYLVNDAGTSSILAALGNSQCTIAFSSSSASGNSLTLTVTINFLPGFAGNKIIYLAARDTANGNSGWQALGTWRVPLPGAPALGPGVGGVNPSGGGAANQTFTFTFTDTAGYQDLGVVNILINNSLDGRSACYIAYNRASNTLFLADDAGTTALPPLVMNGSGTVGNSQCVVNAAGFSAVGSGTTLTLTMNMSFSPNFAGNRIIFMAARDISGVANSLWQPAGTWAVPSLAPAVVSVGGVSPSRGNTASQTFTFTFTDTNGWQDLDVVNVLVNRALDGRNACYLGYRRSDNKLLLVNDSGSFELTPLVLNGSGSLGNSQCTVSGAGSSATGAGNTLTLTLNISFSVNFAGNQVIYMAARDVFGLSNTGWQPSGTWLVPGLPVSPLTVGSVIPNRGNTASQIFTFTFIDNNGWADIGVLNVLVNDFLNGNQACYIAYDRAQNLLYLRNDAGNALLPGLTLGSGSTANSQCTINGTGSSAVGSGNTLTLTLNITFGATFKGNRVIYAAARSNGDVLNSGWQAVGTWTVP